VKNARNEIPQNDLDVFQDDGALPAAREMNLEVLIPVRNPAEVFAQTIDSLAAQTDRDFSVLISDNFSTSGAEQIENALEKLSGAGIAARKIQPPSELGRVEHWNWLHQQSNADWLKPLFAGDWLEPAYVSRVRETAAATPACRYIYSNGYTHRPGLPDFTAHNKWAGRFNTAREMQDVVLRHGMQFGPPSAAAYGRQAFLSAGGYDPKLPIAADSYLFCKLAAQFGAAGIQEKLVHFNIHAARFSTGLSEKRRETFCESISYFFKLARDVRAAGGRIPIFGFLRLLARTTRDYLSRKP
jgi:glycosyltransferase involved in cell wall biosynthesis